MSIKNSFIDYSKGFIQFSYCIAFLVLYIVGRVMSNSNLMGLIGMIPLFLLSLWVCFNKMTSLSPSENNRTKKNYMKYSYFRCYLLSFCICFFKRRYLWKA